MNKLKMYRVESNPGDQPLGSFRRVIFPVADHRMADCRKLRPDLILQSSHQRNPRQRRAGKKPLHGISKFSPSRFRVSLRAQLLKHSHASKMVDECSLACIETPAKNRQVLSHWRMGEELSNQYLPIALRLGEEQNARGETVDAMDHKGSPPLQRQSRANQRQSGRSM